MKTKIFFTTIFIIVLSTALLFAEGFNINIPEEYQPIAQDKGMVVFEKVPGVTVLINSMPAKNQNLEQTTQELLNEWSTQTSNFKKIVTKPRQICSHNTMQFVYSSTNPQTKINYITMGEIVILSNTIHIVKCMAPENLFQQYNQEFVDILNTIQL